MVFSVKMNLKFLDQALSEAEDDPNIEHSLVTLHHNPVPGSSAWMKDIGLRNDREFMEMIKRHTTLRCVVYGHIHPGTGFSDKWNQVLLHTVDLHSV